MSKKMKNQVTEIFSESDIELYSSFQRLNALLLTMSARVAEDMKFTLTEILVCEHLRLDGPLTPRDIGERVGLSSGAVTRLLDRLEERGFTKRASHPSDRRKILMHYIEQEPSTLERPLSILQKLQDVTDTLTETDKRAVITFIKAVNDEIQADLRPKD